METVARVLVRRGYEIRLCPFETFRETLLGLDEAAARANALDPFLPLFFVPRLRLESEPGEGKAAPRFDSRATHRALGREHACPPADEALLDAYLDDFVQRGFLAR